MTPSSSSKKIIRIATRKSPLALWQAYFVKQQLEAAYPDMVIEINGLLTEGDKLLATPLAKIGGKGLFVKELEKAMLERRADIAVHSIKDMPAELLDDMVLAAVCKREDPRDVFVSNRYEDLLSMPPGTVIGTSSSRRCCQIKALRPDLIVENLRGNVGTRLQKLDDEKYDAIILAAAGLERLGLLDRIRSFLPIEQMLPAVGQGAIGIECCASHHEVREWLSVLEDRPTRLCITAERAMNYYLNGGCQLPIAGYATLENGNLKLRGLVGSLDGTILIKSDILGPEDEAENLGQQVAENLLQNGAGSLI
jgi:hydroxymethylbilane synthase